MPCIYIIIAESFFELHISSLFILILDFYFFFSRGEFIKGNVISSTGLPRITTNYLFIFFQCHHMFGGTSWLLKER